VKQIVKIYVDLDGTICGQEDWISWYEATKSLFKTGLLMEIPKHSWSILTARPRIDRFFIKKVCEKYKLYPKEIITSPTWFWQFDNHDEIVDWKSSVLSNSLNELFVDKVIYVDVDSEMLTKMIKQQNIIVCHPSILNKVLKELEETEHDGYM